MPDFTVAPSTPQGVSLTFEQQKALLELQLERDKLAAKEREEQRKVEVAEREKERLLEYEKLKLRERETERENEIQRTKLEQEKERLKLLAEGKLSGGGCEMALASHSNVPELKLSTMVKFLPKFNERDPDIFFSLFENIADDRNWGDSERTLLLQSVITGRAQEAFVALSASQRKNYASVKGAILKAFELVPEAYRQKFRNWRKGDGQTHIDLARELTGFFILVGVHLRAFMHFRVCTT